MARKTFAAALADGAAVEMRRDPSVVVWGVDVGAYGGAFAATKGLYEEFGPERVIDMPISEAGFTGMAVGAAATGQRPIVELQFSDWVTLASDQLINQAAKMRYMFGGTLSVPLVMRLPTGGYLSAGAQHSDSFESIFALIPGLKVVVPSNPADAKGLLTAAIRDDNPVLMFEHKKLYGMRGDVPEGEHLVPLGRAAVVREGTDVTVVTYGYTVGMAIKVAAALQDEVSVEVVDLRTISPLDTATILESASKTGRVVIAHEAWKQFGAGAEVAAVIAEQAFDSLRGPILRVGARHAPIPFAPVLEEQILPQPQWIHDAVREAMKS